ncbi:MAG: hypothetical protein GXO91_07905 [FCB group bacterium]|nr:hypothetical protein [FCB group bacterium]
MNPEPTTDDLKEVLRELFHTAILAEVTDGRLRLHPLRILQAVKSIMGLNLGAPNTELLNWTRAYVESFPTFPAEELKIRILPARKNISYDNLARAIQAQDRLRLEEELGYLAGAASAEQLLEFLLEQSLLQAPAAFLFVWSALRMVRFLGPENSSKVLRISALQLLSDDGFSQEGPPADPFLVFECRGALGQLRQESFIRERTIQSNAAHLEEWLDSGRIPADSRPGTVRASVEALAQTYLKTPAGIDPAAFAAVSGSSPRRWIWDFLSALPKEYLAPELILCLDAGRALLKASPPAEAAAIGYALGENLKRISHA